jgi:hypothetical protein
MMMRISCPCGHTGLACAERLPRKLRCSRCGCCRYVGVEHGKAIVSNAHFEEWLAGGRGRPARKARGERSRMPLSLRRASADAQAGSAGDLAPATLDRFRTHQRAIALRCGDWVRSTPGGVPG